MRAEVLRGSVAEVSKGGLMVKKYGGISHPFGSHKGAEGSRSDKKPVQPCTITIIFDGEGLNFDTTGKLERILRETALEKAEDKKVDDTTGS